MRYREADKAAIREVYRALYESFAVCAASYHYATVLILDGSADDFRC